VSTVPKVGTGRFPRSTAEEVVKTAEPEVPKRHGIGLCLSGGGYRATLFHVGAARRLWELGILQQVRTISSVSGGSIFAAKLAAVAMPDDKKPGLEIHDFDKQVAKPAREVTRHSVRTLPFILTLPFNWLLPGPRARMFRWLLGRRLPKEQISALPESPRFAICATDLTHGVNWVFSRDQAGSYSSNDRNEVGRHSIAGAVAASACFPPFFGPVPVGSRLAGSPRVTLSDGGVYDNMGLEPVWSSHANMLVSDAGAPFQRRSYKTPWGRLMRYSFVLQKQSHSLRLRMLHDGLRGDYKWAFWDLEAEKPRADGYSQSLINERIARVRTDLDRFTEPEQKVLENHGYWAADERVQEYLPHLVREDAPTACAPHPEWMDERRARRALRFSRYRVWPRRMWPPRIFIKDR
jgi:NTE family protein